MPDPYEAGQILAKLFGQFEHDLRKSGYLREGRADAQADWNKFARHLGQDFFDHVKRSGIAETLLSEPPRAR